MEIGGFPFPGVTHAGYPEMVRRGARVKEDPGARADLPHAQTRGHGGMASGRRSASSLLSSSFYSFYSFSGPGMSLFLTKMNPFLLFLASYTQKIKFSRLTKNWSSKMPHLTLLTPSLCFENTRKYGEMAFISVENKNEIGTFIADNIKF